MHRHPVGTDLSSTGGVKSRRVNFVEIVGQVTQHMHTAPHSQGDGTAVVSSTYSTIEATNKQQLLSALEVKNRPRQACYLLPTLAVRSL